MKKVLLAVVISVLMVLAIGNNVSADPSLPLPRLPIGGDQGGPEPLVFHAPGFELLPDVQFLLMPLPGDITFDYVFRESVFNNEFGFFPVDNIQGQVDGINPGEPGYLAAALGRAEIVFASDDDPSSPDVPKLFNGRAVLVFFIVQNGTLEDLKANNPTNDPSKSPLAFFSFDALNPDHFDHFVGFRNRTDDITQFGFEDLTGGGDQDYDDIVYNVDIVLRPSPATKRRDIVFIRGIDSEGGCDGANEWVKNYLSSAEGRTDFPTLGVGKYLNFNYLLGGNYNCPRAGLAYIAEDTCDGIAPSAGRLGAAQELKNLIETEATEKVTIVAHSMGGLVAAYLVASEPDWAKAHIASVITLDSPLKGLSELTLWLKQGIPFNWGSVCKLNPPSSSLIDLADTSGVVKTVEAAKAATIVPFYPLDATSLVEGKIFVPRDRTRLSSAQAFDPINLCGSEFAPAEPDCAPPLSMNDDHSQIWNRSSDGDGKDKKVLIGCAIMARRGCTFLKAPTLQGTTTQTQVNIMSGATRIQFVSGFGSIVRMTLISPDGTVYGPDGAGPVAAYAVDDVSEVYEIVDPAPGTWTIELAGIEVAPGGEEVALSVLVLESTGLGFNIAPIANAGGPYTTKVSEAIDFNGIASFDPDGTIDLYEWDFESDGIFDFSSQDPVAMHSYPAEFSGKVTLRVTDNDGNTGTDTSLVEVTSTAADLSLTKIDNADPVTVGDDVTYTILVTNNGPDPADNVTVSDTFSGADITMKSITSSQGGCIAFPCNLGTINSGSNATITVVVTTNTTGVITNRVEVSSATADPTPTNNSASQDTTVNPVTSDTGTIRLVKNTVGGNETFNFTSTDTDLNAVSITTVGNTGQSSLFTKPIGSYPVSEDAPPANWALTELACTGDTDNGSTITLATREVVIDLDANENIVCTFTNTFTPPPGTGTIIIRKTTSPAGGIGFGFTSTVPGAASFTLDHGQNQTINNVAVGSYTVTEDNPTGYSLTNLVCTDPDNGSTVDVGTRTATIDLDAGETVDCTFTNTQTPPPGEGTITIVKDAQPNSPRNFRFTGDLGDFRLDNVIPADDDDLSNTKTFRVNAGVYTVREDVPENWLLATITCDPAVSGAVDLANNQVTITLTSGGAVTCTFIDQRKSTIRALKYHDQNGDGRRNQDGTDDDDGDDDDDERNPEPGLADWTIRLYDAQQALVAEHVTNEHGKVSFPGLRPANYTVCEELTAGWFNTQPGLIDPTFHQPCYVLTLGVGKIAQVRFGNSDGPVASSVPGAASDGVFIFDAPNDTADDENYDAVNTDEEYLTAPDLVEVIYLPLVAQ